MNRIGDGSVVVTIFEVRSRECWEVARASGLDVGRCDLIGGATGRWVTRRRGLDDSIIPVVLLQKEDEIQRDLLFY